MKNRRIWLLAVLVTGALILVWRFGSTAPLAPQEGQVPPPDMPEDVAAGQPSAGSASAKTNTPRPTAALPPSDMPLPALVALLQPRADAGDSLAACRLGVELLRCDANDYAVTFHERNAATVVRENEAAGKLALANLIEEKHLRQLELQIQCRQLSKAIRAGGADYLIQAARAGEPEALLRYAMGEHWGINQDDFLADGRFDAWRRDTPGMLQRALEAGDPRAAYLLMSAYSDDFSPFSGLVANDPVRGSAFLILHRRLTNRPLSNLRLNAKDAAMAEALAAEMHHRHFDNRRLESPEQAFLPSLFSAGSDGRDPGFCRRRGE